MTFQVIDKTGKRWAVTGSLKLARLFASVLRERGVSCMVASA